MIKSQQILGYFSCRICGKQLPVDDPTMLTSHNQPMCTEDGIMLSYSAFNPIHKDMDLVPLINQKEFEGE